MKFWKYIAVLDLVWTYTGLIYILYRKTPKSILLHTLSFQKVRIIFFLIIETIVFLLTHCNVAAGVTGETGDGMAIGRVGWRRGSSGGGGG